MSELLSVKLAGTGALIWMAVVFNISFWYSLLNPDWNPTMFFLSSGTIITTHIVGCAIYWGWFEPEPKKVELNGSYYSD